MFVCPLSNNSTPCFSGHGDLWIQTGVGNISLCHWMSFSKPGSTFLSLWSQDTITILQTGGNQNLECKKRALANQQETQSVPPMNLKPHLANDLPVIRYEQILSSNLRIIISHFHFHLDLWEAIKLQLCPQSFFVFVWYDSFLSMCTGGKKIPKLCSHLPLLDSFTQFYVLITPKQM